MVSKIAITGAIISTSMVDSTLCQLSLFLPRLGAEAAAAWRGGAIGAGCGVLEIDCCEGPACLGGGVLSVSFIQKVTIAQIVRRCTEILVWRHRHLRYNRKHNNSRALCTRCFSGKDVPQKRST